MIQKILTELKPFVYVVGSYARGTQNEKSDIDLYVKRRSEEELENNGYYDGEGEEHYIDKVIEVFDKYNVSWESLMIGYVHTESLHTMIEASSSFRVDEDEKLEVFPVNVFGIELMATIDNYEG